MPEDSIELLPVLSRLEARTGNPPRVVLFGQPELNDLLAREPLRQLRQRVHVSHTLPALNPAEVNDYVNQRLALAGFPGSGLLSPGAMAALVDASQGIPRLINVLCHKALFVAYSQGDTRVHQRHMLQAIDDAREGRPRAPAQHRPHWGLMTTAGILASGITLLVVYLLNVL